MTDKIIKEKANKFVHLNFNLKNNIFEYLKFKQIISSLLQVNKSFCNSISKLDFIIIIKENDLLNKPTLISFSKDKLNNFKWFFSNIKNINENEEIIEQIYLYLLEKKYSRLKKLFLNKVENLDLNLISKFLMNNKSIQILNLSRNKIGENESDLRILTQALEINSSLTELFLNDNLIGKNSQDIEYISNVIRKNKSICNLAVGKNKIGTYINDIYKLAESLKENKSIRSLYLEYNLIGANDTDLTTIDELLKQNNTLKEIYLFGNKLKEEEGQLLKESHMNIDVFY